MEDEDAMDAISNPPDEPTPGRPARTRRLLAVGAVIAGLAAGATGVALADSTSTPRPSATASTPGGYGPGHGKLGGLRGMMGGRHALGLMGAVLHGELVVPKAGGGYQTVEVQRGQATAVSKTSITVKSADGFSRTYDVTDSTLVNSGRDGITSIAVGKDVAVQGVKNGSRVEALHVADLSRMKELRGRFGPGRNGGAPSGSPTGSPSGWSSGV